MGSCEYVALALGVTGGWGCLNGAEKILLCPLVSIWPAYASVNTEGNETSACLLRLDLEKHPVYEIFH